jgi:hypothetical protein
MVFIILIFIIILIFLFYIKLRNKTEFFIPYKKKFQLGILDNSKINNNFYNANLEITNQELQIMLNQIISKKNLNIKFNKNKKKVKIDKNSYKKIKNKFINLLNSLLTKNKKQIRLFKIIDDKIINYKINKDYIQIIFIINIYRIYKYSAFQIYIISLYDKQNKNIVFEKIKIIANIKSQNINLLPGYNKQENYPFIKYSGERNYIKNYENNKIIPSELKIKEINNNREKIKKIDLMEKNYKCYGSEGEDFYNCLANKNILNQHKKKGIWGKMYGKMI